MATNIEIEVKVLLTKKEYNKVLRYFDKDVSDGFIQKNYYIDTKDRALRNLGLSLRIRKLNGYVMTLKLPMAEGLLEKSQNLKSEQFDLFMRNNVFPTGDIADFIESLYINPNSLLINASLSTLRIEVGYENFLLAIDENRYGDHQDFELEMESNSIQKARELLQQICEKVGIEFKENFDSKQKRAVAALNGSLE